jgi:hypothetical protein
MLSLPALIALGFPPEIALATNKMGDLARFTTSSIPFFRSKNIEWKLVWTFIPLAILGGIIGPILLKDLANYNLSLVIGIVILAMAPIAFVSKKFGIEESDPKTSKKGVGYLAYFIVVLYGATLQVASGVMLIYVLIWFFGRTFIQANATNIIIWLVITITSLISFAYYGMIDYGMGLIIMVGSAIGGYLGAHTAIKKGKTWVKKIFILLIIIMALKVLVFGEISPSNQFTHSTLISLSDRDFMISDHNAVPFDEIDLF